MLKITCNIYQQRDKYLQTLEVLVFQEDLNYLVFLKYQQVTNQKKLSPDMKVSIESYLGKDYIKFSKYVIHLK